LISVLVSVILAVIALWARIRFRLTPSAKINNVQKQQDEEEEKDEKNFDYPTTFFFHIADKHRPDKKNTKKPGSTYFEDEIKKYKSEEEWLKGMAREITILSWHLKKKYQLINFSFVSVAVALVFMSAIVFLTMFNNSGDLSQSGGAGANTDTEVGGQGGQITCELGSPCQSVGGSGLHTK